MLIWWRQHRDTAENIDAHGLEALELEGIIGHQLHALHEGNATRKKGGTEFGCR